MSATATRYIGPIDGKVGSLRSIDVRFMIDGLEAGERFSLVEHPMGHRALSAPLRRHNREDDYNFVRNGCMCDEVLKAGHPATSSSNRNQCLTF